MNYRLRFLPEVAGDVVAGSRWYEERSPGLGEDFARMVYARSDEISRNPLVVGLFHSARRPATTAATLEDRAGRRPDQG